MNAHSRKAASLTLKGLRIVLCQLQEGDSNPVLISPAANSEKGSDDASSEKPQALSPPRLDHTLQLVHVAVAAEQSGHG